MTTIRRIIMSILLLSLCLPLVTASADDFGKRLDDFERSSGSDRVAAANALMRDLNALELTDGLMTFAETTSADTLRRQVYYWAGEYYYDRQDYAMAVNYGEKALPLCRGRAEEADCLNLLALSCFRLTRYSKAADYAKQCYALDEKTGDPDVMSSSLNTLAGIYLGANRLDEAKRYITRAIAEAGRADNPPRLAVLHGMASEIYHAANDDATAVAHIDKACDIESRLGSGRLATRLVQKASVLNGLKRYDEAEKLLSAVLPELERGEDKHSLGTALNKMGMAVRSQGRDREAVAYFRRAASLFSEMGDLAGEMHARRGLYESLWDLNRDSAKIELDRFDLLKDSLYSHASAESLARYNAEFGNNELTSENKRLSRRVLVVTVSLLLIAVLMAAAVWWLMRRRMRVREEALNAIINTLRNDRDEVVEKPAPVVKPDEADEQFLARLVSAVRDALNAGSAVSVESLAGEMCVSRGHLNRRVKALTGITTRQYVNRIRLEYARHLLDEKEMTVAEVGYRCGFDDPSSFTRAFRLTFGKSPTAYRNGE